MSVRRQPTSLLLSLFLCTLIAAAPALAAPEEARQTYRQAVKAAMQPDKSITEEQREALDHEKATLGLTDEEAQEIEQEVQAE